VNVALTGCDPVVMIPEDGVAGAIMRSVLAFAAWSIGGRHESSSRPEQGTRLRATGEGGFSFGLGARIAPRVCADWSMPLLWVRARGLVGVGQPDEQ